MHISSLNVVMTLFVGIVFTSHTSQSSVSRLTRRDRGNNHAPFANMYIMKDKLEYSQDGLLVYYPNGSIAYIFDKSVRDIRQGISSVVLRNQYHQPLLTLNSVSFPPLASRNQNPVIKWLNPLPAFSFTARRHLF
jgi:hypothetical protein